MDAWLTLVAAGVFEVGFTTCLKLEERSKWFIVPFLICAGISFTLLSQAMETIPLGTAYAVWTGIGAVGTVLVGALAFGERLKPATLALLGVVVELSQTDAEVAHLWDAAKRAFNDRIVRSLERGIAAGQMRDDLDLALAAEMLRSMTEYYAFQRFVLNGSGLSDVSLEQATNAIAEIWISGMGLDREPAATRTAPSGA